MAGSNLIGTENSDSEGSGERGSEMPESGTESEILYAQFLNPTDDWMELTEGERQEFLEDAAVEVMDLTEGDLEIVGFALNEGKADHKGRYRYAAIWKSAKTKNLERLDELVTDHGWNDYFEIAGVRGRLVSPCVARTDMTKL